MSLSLAEKENLLYSILSLFAGATLGYAVYLNTYLLDGLGIITYEYMLKTELPSAAAGWYFGALGVLFVAALYWVCLKASPVVFNWKILGTALLPQLILFPTFFFPVGFYSPMIFTAVSGLTVFRLALALPLKQRLKPEISSRTGLLLVLLFSLLLVAWWAFIQAKAVKILFMGYHDWGLYFNIIDNTLKGRWFYADIAQGSFLPTHFEPGMVLLLAPYVWLFRTPGAFFVLTSALLFCGGIFVYLFARHFKVSPRAALALSFCALLFPSLSNMNIAIFYGFHSLYVTIPLIFLYFYFFEKKNYTAAFCMFMVSLTIKETVAVFWVGLGLVYLINGNRKFGLLLIAVACAYFLIIVKVVVPAISPQGAYDYSNRYAEYGGGMIDMLLAPFTRPVLFWGTLFRPHCIAFVLLLIIPFYTLLLSRPLLLLAGCITIGFVCLQTNDQLQNICIWYQSEYVALLLTCAVLNYKGLLETYHQRINPWFRALAWKIDLDRCREKLPSAVILSLLTTTCFSYYFFGLSVTGKNSVMPILGAENCDEDVRRILQIVPPGIEVTSSARIGAHFILRNPVSIGYVFGQKLKDYVILDVNDPIDVRFSDPARFKLLKDKEYNLIVNQKFKGHQVLIFHREPQSYLKSPLVQIPEEKWGLAGKEITVNNPNFAVRGGIAAGSSGKRCAVFFVRLLNKVDLDVETDIQLYDGIKLINQRFLFGDGAYPACFASPGDCFPIRIQLPDDFGDVKSFSVEIRERVPVSRWTASAVGSQ